MNSDRDEDLRDSIDDESRSIFSALWFRVVLVVLVLGVVAAVALPYLLDVIAPSAPHTARKPTQQGARAMPAPAVAAPAAPALSVVTPAVATPEPPPPIAATPSPPAAPRSAVPAKPAPAPAVTRPTRAATPTPAPATRPAAQAPVVVGRVVEAPKADAPTSEPKRAAAAPRAAASAPKPAAATPKASAAKGAPGGYWVQVGAFRDPAAAKRVAESLRGRKFQVDESVKLAAAQAAPAAPSDGDRYSVVVSGRSPDDIKRSLSAKSLRAEPASGGWTIVPAMPLADAVALSRDLAVDGLTVQVRRTGAAARPVADTNAEPLNRVRVGPYPDRPAAVAVVRQLEAAGYKPFIARGPE